MMRSPKETLERLDDLHEIYSAIALKLIEAYARGDKCKIARDEAIAAEQVIFLFDRAVQRQIWR